jgi:release factor glutamine methyltransferase
LGAAVEFSLVGADAFLPTGTPPIDLIVSNPPYVPARDRDSLPPDVRDFEPAAALFGGDDGLEVIRALLPVAARALAPDGTLLMEIGAGQAERIEELVRAAPLEFVRFQADLQGIPRVLVARRTSV